MTATANRNLPMCARRVLVSTGRNDNGKRSRCTCETALTRDSETPEKLQTSDMEVKVEILRLGYLSIHSKSHTLFHYRKPRP